MSDSNTKMQQFEVQGMHCNSCALSIDWEVEDVEGVVDSTTSYAKGTTQVVFDESKASMDAILGAIKTAGFEARPV